MAYTPSELREMIRNAADCRGVNNAHAVAHILCFLDLADSPEFFEKHLEFTPHDLRSGDTHTEAWPADWSKLLTMPGLSGSVWKLLTLARALDEMTTFHLPDIMSGLGSVYARTVAETVLIATGYGDWYTFFPTKVKRNHDSWQRRLSGTAAEQRAELQAELDLLVVRMNEVNAELSGQVPE